MSFIQGLLEVLLVPVCLILIAVVLVQDSKDGGLASAFGGGGGGQLLGARGQRELARLTSVLAVIFIVFVLVVGVIHNAMKEKGGMGGEEKTAGAPAEPVGGASGERQAPPAAPTPAGE